MVRQEGSQTSGLEIYPNLNNPGLYRSIARTDKEPKKLPSKAVTRMEPE
jgi:hypothetical protein